MNFRAVMCSALMLAATASVSSAGILINYTSTPYLSQGPAGTQASAFALL